MRIKKSGQIVMETNVKILIVVIVVALVLSGIFFFGDKFSVIYDNFIPKTDVPEDIDEIIPVEERVDYNYDNFKQSGTPKSVSMSAYEIQKILEENTILEVRRNGKTIVKGNFQSFEDADPKTEMIEFAFFNVGAKLFVNLMYDARLKKVYGKYYTSTTPDVFYDLDCILGGRLRETNVISSFLTDEEIGALSKVVCQSNQIEVFVENILEIVKDSWGPYNCRIKMGVEYVKDIPGRTTLDKKMLLYRILTKNRLNYLSSWGIDGTFSSEKLEEERYTCIFSDQDIKKCKKLVNSGQVAFFSLDSSNNYSLSESDEIFYIKDKEIWRLVYPRLEIIFGRLEYKDRLDEVFSNGAYRWGIENHCYASLIAGEKCK